MNENLEKEYILSSRKRRIAAFIIDHFTFTFLIVGIVFLSLGTDFMDENNFNNLTTKMLPTMIIGFVLYYLYSLLAMIRGLVYSTKRGQGAKKSNILIF